MAPIKRTRESSARNRDKPKRRRRTEADMLYQSLGKLCGEECDQEIVPVSDSVRRNDEPEDAMDGTSDYSEDERETRESRESRGSKGGRVSKHKAKKASVSNHQTNELPLKLGVQKAKRYICEALEFGVQSGYLLPKDPKGKVLRVSSDLLHVSEAKKARVLQRIPSDVLEPRQERKSTRKRAHHDAAVCDGLCGEHHDGAAEVDEAFGKQRGIRKHRSRSRQTKKRSATITAARSRSRSKSKRRAATVSARKKPAVPRSKVNPTPEARPSKQLKPDAEEQEDMGESQNESRNGTRNDDNDEDGKSVKSAKSAKSTLNSDSQNTNEEKKHDDDGSNYEASDDEDDNKK